MSSARRTRFAGTLVLLLVAVGCGGGGGGGGTTPTPPVGPIEIVSNRLGTLICLEILAAAEPGVEVERTALSADGLLAAVGDAAGNVSLFEADSGARRFRVSLPAPGTRFDATPSEGHANGFGRRVVGLVFLPGDSELLAVNGYGTLVRYAVSDGQAVQTTLLPSAVARIAVNAAGTRLAVGTDRGGIEEFSLPGLTPTRTFRAADGLAPVHLLRYGPGDATLLSALSDFTPPGEPGAPPAGPPLDAGLTRWDATGGAPLLQPGTIDGSASAFEDDGLGALVVGREDGRGLLLNRDTGAETAAGLDLHGGLVPILAGGQAHAVTCGFFGLALLRLGDRAVVAYAPLPLGFPPFTPRSLASRAGGDRFCVGRQDGTAAVYHYVPRPSPEPIGVTPRDEVLGTAFGATLRVVADLVGHADRVEEIAVSRDGNFVLSRDRSGMLIAWDRTPPVVTLLQQPGAARTRATAVSASLGTCPASPRLTFGPDGTTALATTATGTVLRIAMPAGTVLSTITVMNGATPIDVHLALDTAPDTMLVTSTQGGVFGANAAGVVQQVITPETPTGAGEVSPVLVSTLRHAPSQPAVLFAPDRFVPDLGDTQPAVLLDPISLNAQATLNHEYDASQFAFLGGGAGMLMAGRGGYHRFRAFDNTLTLVREAIDGPTHGVAATGGSFVLGLRGAHLQLLRDQGGQVEFSDLVAHGMGGTALGIVGSPVDGRARIRCGSGRIREVRVEAP